MGHENRFPNACRRQWLQPLRGHQDPGVEKAPIPNASPVVRNVVTPLRSGSASKPDDLRKDGPSPQGHKKVQEAKATRRKAQGIHNLVDRAIGLTPKGG